MSHDLYTEKTDIYYSQVREDIVGMVDFDAGTILDIGCGTGATARALGQKARAKRVVGVELPGGVASRAASVLDEVHAMSAEEVRHDHFQENEFDLILCADVLEHLVDPWEMLRKIRRWIDDSGRLIVSIPHMGHLTVLLKLTFDRLEYEAEGILDRTHLKFFTLHTITDMLESTGFQVERVEVNRSRTLKFRILDILTLPLGSRLSIYQYRLIARPV